MIGLAGAHRTGKTTLAQAFCERRPDYTFLPTNLSSVFAERGITPKADCPFEERLMLQNLLLDKCEEVYASAPRKLQVITDRTPIDVLGYTLAEIGRTTLHGNEELTKAYLEHEKRAYNITDRFITSCLIVQPGIKIVEAEGKAPGCELYIDHLNILISNLAFNFFESHEIAATSFSMTDLDARLDLLGKVANRGVEVALGEASQYRKH